MDLLKLQYFLGVANSPNMQKAAEVLNVSQSTLSLAVKHLEQEFQVKLFDRSHQRMVLTDAGRLLQSEASNLLIHADNIRQQMALFQSQPESSVLVATEAPDFTAEAELLYRHHDPGYRTIQSLPLRNAVKPLLLAGKVDFAVTLFDDSDSEVESMRLFSEPLLLLVNEEHPLHSCEQIDFRQLRQETLISLGEGYGFRLLSEYFFSMNGTKLPGVHEVRDPEVTPRAVRGGFGVGLIPKCTYLQYEDQFPHVRGITINDRSCRRQVYLTWLRDRVRSPAADIFFQFLIAFGRWIGENGAYPSAEALSRLLTSIQGCFPG